MECMNKIAVTKHVSAATKQVLITCIGTGTCTGVTFRLSAGADLGRYLLFPLFSALGRLLSSSAGAFVSRGGPST